MNRFAWPFLIFAAIVLVMASAARRDPREIPSPLVGRPAPAFSLPSHTDKAPFSTDRMRGKLWLLNVWASWCTACRAEHPLLVELGKRVIIVGLNYKEVRGNAAMAAEKLSPEAEKTRASMLANDWLGRHGNPYAHGALDLDGRAAIDYGVYGVPETFLIDPNGIVRFKKTGALTQETLDRELLPLIARLASP